MTKASAFSMLWKTSRTFFIPISRLAEGPKLIVGSYYLCLRAIDELEDHQHIPGPAKAKLLRNVSSTMLRFNARSDEASLQPSWGEHGGQLPQVTLRLAEWVMLCPGEFRGRIAESTAAMADRMANWAEAEWRIESEGDLDNYTMSVAGAVGLTLSEIWEKVEGVCTDRTQAVEFGRGLQAINILRNKQEDEDRGVTFYPPGWTQPRMLAYAREKLAYGRAYESSLPQASQARKFCSIPLGLAEATANVIAGGGDKLSREEVERIAGL